MNGHIITPLVNLPTAPLYLGWAEHNSKRTATERMRSAIEAFKRQYKVAPQEIHCHPEDAGGYYRIDDIPVIGDGRARNVYLVGPVAEWQSVGEVTA